MAKKSLNTPTKGLFPLKGTLFHETIQSIWGNCASWCVVVGVALLVMWALHFLLLCCIFGDTVSPEHLLNWHAIKGQGEASLGALLKGNITTRFCLITGISIAINILYWMLLAMPLLRLVLLSEPLKVRSLFVWHARRWKLLGYGLYFSALKGILFLALAAIADLMVKEHQTAFLGYEILETTVFVCCLGAIYCLFRLVLFPAPVALEEKNPLTASWHRTYGHFWRMFGFFVAILLLSKLLFLLLTPGFDLIFKLFSYMCADCDWLIPLKKSFIVALDWVLWVGLYYIAIGVMWRKFEKVEQ